MATLSQSCKLLDPTIVPPPYTSRALGVVSWYPILPALVAFDWLLPNSTVLLSGSLTPPDACDKPAVVVSLEKVTVLEKVATPEKVAAPDIAAPPSTVIPKLAVTAPVKLDVPVTARFPVLLRPAVVRTPVLAVLVTIKGPVTRLGPLTSRTYCVPRKNGAKFDTRAKGEVVPLPMGVCMSCVMIKRKYDHKIVCDGAVKSYCVIQF